MEAIFAVRRITSQRTEFANVVQALQTRNIDEVADILENVSENDPYTTLKKAIINRIRVFDEKLV